MPLLPISVPKRLAIAFGMIGLVLVASCQQSAPPPKGDSLPLAEESVGPVFFEALGPECGVVHTYHDGREAGHYALIESLGGGGAAFDYDRDGLLDLFLVGGGYFSGPDKKEIKGHRCRLFRNLGGWKFQDVTDAAGLQDVVWPYTHGVAVGDYDRDGWPDLVVTGYGKVLLFHNVPGGAGRRFADVTAGSGLDRPYISPTSAAFADLDGDGFLDLYVCQYVEWNWQTHKKCAGFSIKYPHDICSPKAFNSIPHFLFRGDGQGHFTDVSREAGILIDPKRHPTLGKGLGVLIADLNDDCKPDIYATNDTVDNFLYINRSAPGKIQLEEAAEDWGVAKDMSGNANASMGVDAADVDGNGKACLFVTNFEDEFHAFYRLTKFGTKTRFMHQSLKAGFGEIGNAYVGWGTVFLDLDNDGWEDVMITNGHVNRHPPKGNEKQKPVLFKNLGNQTFRPITAQGGSYFREAHNGRGLVCGDLDNDGRPDLVVSHLEAPAAVLKNVYPAKNSWLGVELMGKDLRDQTGTKLVMQVGGRTLTRFLKSGGSYASCRDPRILFGLGDAKVAGRLTVHWAWGEPRVESWDGLAIGRYHTVEQGKGKAE